MSASSLGVPAARAASRGAARGSWRKDHRKAVASVQPESTAPDKQRDKPVRLNPTHFLSLPLGHHIGLCNRVQRFTEGLINADPVISGLERSVIIEPARLHITLGVMHLKDPSKAALGNMRLEAQGSDVSAGPTPKTVADALALLESLREPIAKELEGIDGEGLPISLDAMGVLQTEKGGMAHVLWIGPKHSRIPTPLDKVAKLINSAFRREGFITEKRPLKLHCTIINTIYRKGSKRRIPFSSVEIYSSDAYKTIALSDNVRLDEQSGISQSEAASTRRIDFGMWKINDVQLCQMGSRDPTTGAYISAGGITL